LQSCLEQVQTRQETVDSALARYPEQADELRPLLEAASWLHEQRPVNAPRPEFLVESRQRLVARLEREKPSTNAQAPPTGLPTWWSALAALFAQKRFAYQFAVATLLVIFLVVSSSGIAFASRGTIPGDALYPVKTSLEKVQLGLSLSDARRAQLHIIFAERRLVEIQNLVLENRFEYMHSAVEAFEAEVTQVESLLLALDQRDPERSSQLSSELRRIVQDQAAMLPVLAQLSPSENQGDIQRLEQLFGAIVSEEDDDQIPLTDITTPTPTGTLASTNTATPVPGSPTPAVTPTVPTAVPSATTDPLLTASPQVTPVTSGTPRVGTGTPVPTADSGSGIRPLPTIQPNDEEVPPEGKPKKDHPNPPRRPPKPPKPKVSDK
jgi:hypothetical protein